MSLVTLEGLEIVQAGVAYQISTGVVSFTLEDLADAVRASQEDPAIKAPRLKLGHTSRLNAAIQQTDDGQPALGTCQNMRLNDQGNVILGDYVGVPKWLADVMASAYPSRSFEGDFNYKSNGTDRTYRMVIKAVALLGVTWPGCATIDDVQALYGDDMPEGVELAAAEKIGGVKLSFSVAASVNVDDIRRQFYDGPGKEDDDFLWVQAIYVDPYEIIVMNEDENQLLRYPYECSPEGEVTFGDPQPVIVQYVPDPLAAGSKMAMFQCAGKQVVAYANRSESRPETIQSTGGSQMTPEEFRASLGLPPEATDDEVRAKIAELQGQTQGEPEGGSDEDRTEGSGQDAPEDAPAADASGEGSEAGRTAEPVAAADGTVTVPAEVWASIQAGAARGNEVYETQQKQLRDETIHLACEKGKIAASQREQFQKLWEKDPTGTHKLLTARVEDGGLADNLVPVEARGSSPGGEADLAAADPYPESWLSDGERARIATAAGRS